MRRSLATDVEGDAFTRAGGEPVGVPEDFRSTRISVVASAVMVSALQKVLATQRKHSAQRVFIGVEG